MTQYASYSLTDTMTLNARAEILRDQNDFFVAAYPGNLDFVSVEVGLPASFVKFAARARHTAE